MSHEEEQFQSKKIPELKALCKEKNLPVSGTKAELIARLLGHAPPPKKAKTKPQKSTILDKPVFEKLVQSRDPIVIKRNVHGHFEHPETRLIFSPQKKVVGIQTDSSPDPQPLQTKDLEKVYQFHFQLDESCVVHDESANVVAQDEAVQRKRLDELEEHMIAHA